MKATKFKNNTINEITFKKDGKIRVVRLWTIKMVEYTHTIENNTRNGICHSHNTWEEAYAKFYAIALELELTGWVIV